MRYASGNRSMRAAFKKKNEEKSHFHKNNLNFIYISRGAWKCV